MEIGALLFGFVAGVVVSYGWLRHQKWWQKDQRVNP